MKIVAFLQNPWFPEGTAERHILMYRDNQKFHRLLLGKTMSGGRLMTAFGELYNNIHWDNTNWRPAWKANGREDPDHTYMRDVIIREQPQIVLCFGNQARDAVKVVEHLLPVGIRPKQVMSCHHPNARFKTQKNLDDFADKVRGTILQLELLGNELPISAEDIDEKTFRHHDGTPYGYR